MDTCYICSSVDSTRSVALIPSRHTVEDVTLSRAVVAEHGFAKATIVTSQFHLRRARLIFQQVFGPGYALGFVGAAAPVGLRELAGLYRHEFRRTAELKRSGFTCSEPAANLDAEQQNKGVINAFVGRCKNFAYSSNQGYP